MAAEALRSNADGKFRIRNWLAVLRVWVEVELSSEVGHLNAEKYRSKSNSKCRAKCIVTETRKFKAFLVQAKILYMVMENFDLNGPYLFGKRERNLYYC